jgi:predicted nucleic-acid-binding protein
MLAVDTNVVVRYVVGDDRRQAEQARAVIDGEAVFIPLSVILETEWVLRSAYGYPFQRIAAALTTLAGQPSVTLEQPLVVRTAIGLAEHGIDFADALHLAASQHCAAFVSFDRDLAKAAKNAGAMNVRQP